MKLQLVSSPRKHLNCRIILKWLKGKFLFDSFTYDPRTNDTHPSHQYENHLPTKYFHDLAIEFERKLMIYRSQIDLLEGHLAVGGETGTESNIIRPLTVVSALSELPMALEKLHQTYIALAAGVQIIITALEKVKQKYLNYR